MAGITPQQMVLNVQDELHDNSLGADRIYRWINTTQEDMDSRTYWHHLESTPPFQLSIQGPDSNGSVSVVNGSAVVIGTGTNFTAAYVGQPFTAQNDNIYYFVSSVQSATQLTLQSIYIGSTSASTGFTLDYFSYGLPATVSAQKIKSCLIENPHRELKYVDVQERNELFPNLLSGRSQPRAWMDWGASQIQFWPVPDGQYNVIVRFQALPLEASATQTSFSWPIQMHRTIQMGAIAEGWRWKDDNLAPDAAAKYEKMLQNDIFMNNRRVQNKIVTRPFDEQTYTDKFALIYGRRISG